MKHYPGGGDLGEWGGWEWGEEEWIVYVFQSMKVSNYQSIKVIF